MNFMNFMVLWEHWPTFAKLDPTESADCTTPLVDWASLLILSGGRGLSSLKSIRRYSWVGSIWQHKKHPLITLDHTPMEKEQHMGTWTCPRFFHRPSCVAALQISTPSVLLEVVVLRVTSGRSWSPNRCSQHWYGWDFFNLSKHA